MATGVKQDVIEVSEEEVMERVRGGGAAPLSLQLSCHGDLPSGIIIGIISLTAGQWCGAYMPLDLKPAQARPSATPPGCPTHLC